MANPSKILQILLFQLKLKLGLFESISCSVDSQDVSQGQKKKEEKIEWGKNQQ